MWKKDSKTGAAWRARVVFHHQCVQEKCTIMSILCVLTCCTHYICPGTCLCVSWVILILYVASTVKAKSKKSIAWEVRQ
jgi:hypothetical protein